MKYKNAHTPRLLADGNIVLTVDFDGLGEIEFVASPADAEDHGRELFERAMAGDFGAVAPYTPEPETAHVPLTCTSLEFMDRFTEAELLGIVSATMSVALVKLWYDRLIAATEVVYADPRVLAGLQALVSAGLLDAQRVDEILPPAWRGEAAS